MYSSSFRGNNKFGIKSRSLKGHAFKDVHPGSQAGKQFIGQDLPAWGGSEGLESDFVYCVQCGYPNDTSLRSLGNGYGNITNIAVSSSDAREPVTGAGCVFCGSSNYIGGTGQDDIGPTP